MRLLFDQGLSFELRPLLADVYPGSSQARLPGLDRASDRALWDPAAENGFVLVTQDADFAEMAALFGPPPKVIRLRGGNMPTAVVAQTLRRGHALIAEFIADDENARLEVRV